MADVWCRRPFQDSMSGYMCGYWRVQASLLNLQDLPWATIETSVAEGMAAVVGAQPSEIAVMNTLTTNLHLLMVPFYKPTATRCISSLEA
jgi:kynureninase